MSIAVYSKILVTVPTWNQTETLALVLAIIKQDDPLTSHEGTQSRAEANCPGAVS